MDNPGTGKLREEETDEDSGAPGTRSFLEGLFPSLRDDLQAVKRDLSQDLKVARRELEEVGERVAALGVHENARGKEIKQLKQEIIQLQDLQIELQVHTEDLENQSRWNNICIRGAPTRAGEVFILVYVQALFHQILGESSEREVHIDRVHRVGPLRPSHVPPADILACIHDFPLKACILQTASEQQPLKFRGHTLLLYQDLAAITLQKWRDF
ncbi:hypothetical protein NDU88_002731 [Pleurodeles waltl]|uniref:Uncharacterized protein n=1 Tax=Pleurodeles waltl TaxID=8319 RepID=A0AAV7UAL7_PLEWA|nr:hypothetical protein NDU88_002731 [Pleurodeles waltl]